MNTRDYWDDRFASGDWQTKGGFSQTKAFAESFVPHLGIDPSFTGSLCDFGCGAGDSIPVYRRYFPRARLIGIDFSSAAIDLCKARYGDQAQFLCGDIDAVPRCDVIVASNVFEHLSEDRRVAEQLLTLCTDFYIVVPYKEALVPGGEHINRYDESSFDYLGAPKTKVFLSRGWSLFGREYLREIIVRNVGRFLLGRELRTQRRQIVFRFTRTGGAG